MSTRVWWDSNGTYCALANASNVRQLGFRNRQDVAYFREDVDCSMALIAQAARADGSDFSQRTCL